MIPLEIIIVFSVSILLYFIIAIAIIIYSVVKLKKNPDGKFTEEEQQLLKKIITDIRLYENETSKRLEK